MKTLLAIGMIAFSLSFCNLFNKNKNDNNNSGSSSGGNSNNSNNTNNGNSGNKTGSNSGGDATVEKPNPTAAQTASVENGLSVSWNDQGMHWTVPTTWKESSTSKDSLVYASPDHASLIVTVSDFGADFPVEVSLKSYYDRYLAQMKAGTMEEARMLELDGIKGVQWREKGDGPSNPRRLQWIGYRKYNGQVQYVSVMLATNGANFAQHQDEFYGILYTTRMDK
jgi:hypothetical protein